MKYRNGQEIAVGDAITHVGLPGAVVGIATEAGSAHTAVGFDWTAQAERGLWVQFSNGATVHLDDVDEDLEFVTRGETPRQI